MTVLQALSAGLAENTHAWYQQMREETADASQIMEQIVQKEFQ
jgi:hypothetical protein